ncbi:MAG: peptidoglycan DD-metalloendopeptidase family protein [Ruminococcus sp.]
MLNEFSDFIAGFGENSIEIIKSSLKLIVKFISAICHGTVRFITEILKGIINIIKFIFSPFKRKMKFTAELGKSIKNAKKQGTGKFIAEIFRSIFRYLFSDEGIVCTAFNYILPIFSVAFLIGIIRYGTGLEYGISVEYNGKNLGIISEESEFDEAAKEVQKRISYVDNNEYIEFSPKFSLKIISEDDSFMSTQQLANKMLSESNRELAEAYGIYVDGQFIGAVRDKNKVSDTMTKNLLDYKVDGEIRDMRYSKSIDYVEGIYLTESVISEDEAIKKLTAKNYVTGSYVVQPADSIVSVCQKYNMTEEKLKELNPSLNDDESLVAGTVIKVLESESFIPIQYIRELETTSFIDYETVEVETSEINLGKSELLVKGSRGEKQNKIEVTYIDGAERSRKVLSSVITKEPIVEQIGIGTYTAKPASEDTVLTGSGKFAWPVDGGFISDPFISDRNHKGMDIAAPAGTDIYAAADGVVVASGWNTGGYGYFVMIDHLDGYETLYGHCSGLYVAEGQTVTRGQLIACVGSTGDSTGNHCHFEVRESGMCVNPASYINTAE